MAPPRLGKKGKASGKGKAPASSAQPDLPDAILEDIPAPIATLNLGDDPEKMAASYQKCVKDILEFVKTESGKGFTFAVEGDHEHEHDRYIPLTPSVNETPTGAYTIAITDGRRTLRLVAQKYQTWFRVIVTDSGDRFEIDGMTPKMMVGSGSLYTFSRYNAMLGNTADQCKVGYHRITDAFHTLVAHPNSTGDSDGATAVILVMLYEAPRFPAVYRKCLQFIREMKDDFVGENLRQLINGWCKKCHNFYKENQEQETVVLTEGSSAVIKEIAQEFSILCRSAWDRWLLENGKEEDTSGGGAGGGGSKPKKTVGASGSSHSK